MFYHLFLTYIPNTYSYRQSVTKEKLCLITNRYLVFNYKMPGIFEFGAISLNYIVWFLNQLQYTFHWDKFSSIQWLDHLCNKLKRISTRNEPIGLGLSKKACPNVNKFDDRIFPAQFMLNKYFVWKIFARRVKKARSDAFSCRGFCRRPLKYPQICTFYAASILKTLSSGKR